MNLPNRFRYHAALLLLLLLGLLVRVQAAPLASRPPSISQLTTSLTQALRLSPAQASRLQAPLRQRSAAWAALRQRRFASPAQASAAYTVVEYRYFTALAGILTPAQFAVFISLDEEAPAPGRLTAR